MANSMLHTANSVMSTSEAAEILGIAHRTLINRVESGTVTPAQKLPGKTGAYLFDRAYIEQIAADERDAAQRRPALAAKKAAAAGYAIQDEASGVILLEVRHVNLDGGDTA